MEEEDQVRRALETASVAVEEMIMQLKAEALASVDAEQFDVVARIGESIEPLRRFSSRVGDLLDEWTHLRNAVSSIGPESAPRGSTPRREFHRPILEALVDAGGSLPAGEALSRLEASMSARFTATDFESFPSDRSQIRWRSTAHLAQGQLADDGLIDRRARGVWSITDEGRRWLTSHSQES